MAAMIEFVRMMHTEVNKICNNKILYIKNFLRTKNPQGYRLFYTFQKSFKIECFRVKVRFIATGGRNWPPFEAFRM